MQSPIAADSSGPIILIQPRAVAENAEGSILDLMLETLAQGRQVTPVQ